LNESLRNARKQSRPPIVGPPSLKDEFTASVEDSFISSMAPESIQFMPVQDALRGLLPLLQAVLQLSDGASSSPALISGAPDSNPNKTATAASIQQMGFNLAMSNDVTRYSKALIQCARLTIEWLANKNNSELQAEIYRIEASKAQKLRESLAGQLSIQVNGQSPESQPMFKQQVSERVASLVAQLAGDIPEASALRGALVYEIIANSSLPNRDNMLEVAKALVQGSFSDADNKRELTESQYELANMQMAMQAMSMAGPQQPEQSQGQMPMGENQPQALPQ